MTVSSRFSNIIAVAFLIFVFIISVLSMKNDSLTSDELVHLPAGYSYLTQKDMRLNPEHPPLLKDLSAIPLLFIKNINFPSQISAWRDNVNDQWEFGAYFLYNANNPVEKMVFWGRIPMILILVVLGFYIYLWTKKYFGNKAGLLALFLFSFSPTFLAHGKLVTTDVGAAAGFFISTFYFFKFLNNPSRKNIIIAGIVLGLAELLKFSLVLLFPFFALILFLWVVKVSLTFKEFLKNFKKYFIYFILVLFICFAVIWLVYLYHVWNYPLEKQVNDTRSILKDNNLINNTIIWIAGKPILRPFAHYAMGVVMAIQRTSGGEPVYFFGKISTKASKLYFPFLYFTKEPLVFHILFFIVVFYCIFKIKKSLLENRKNFLEQASLWLSKHFVVMAMIIFIIFYWTVTLKSNLTIGIRHLLPVFPFTIFLVGGGISSWLKNPYLKIKKLVLFWLVLWQAYSVLSAFPHFLPYFNEIIGGSENGYLYVADSNVDWGQDLKRLSRWVNKNKIKKIYVDYSGGYNREAEKYYLKEKHAPWWGQRDPKELPKNSYLAVSVFFLQRGRGKPAPDFNGPSGYYLWLNKYKSVARIGYSIFIYYIY